MVLRVDVCRVVEYARASCLVLFRLRLFCCVAAAACVYVQFVLLRFLVRLLSLPFLASLFIIVGTHTTSLWCPDTSNSSDSVAVSSRSRLHRSSPWIRDRLSFGEHSHLTGSEQVTPVNNTVFAIVFNTLRAAKISFTSLPSPVRFNFNQHSSSHFDCFHFYSVQVIQIWIDSYQSKNKSFLFSFHLRDHLF